MAMKQVSRPSSNAIVHITCLGEVVVVSTCSASQKLERELPSPRLSTIFDCSQRHWAWLLYHEITTDCV